MGCCVSICLRGLTVWSEGELDVIAGELNDRPRKTLDWDTPRERFGVLLAS